MGLLHSFGSPLPIFETWNRAPQTRTRRELGPHEGWGRLWFCGPSGYLWSGVDVVAHGDWISIMLWGPGEFWGPMGPTNLVSFCGFVAPQGLGSTTLGPVKMGPTGARGPTRDMGP